MLFYKGSPLHELPDFSLANNHSLSNCWHPHYHFSEPFRATSANLFERWHKRTYPAERLFKRAAALCVFGGTSYIPYVHGEHAHGTYAVCPSCETVMMCGYHDKNGIGPVICEKCGKKLELNDYFQPVFEGSVVGKDDLIDPTQDPAVTIAEICALSPGGIPNSKLGALFAILGEERLLQTADFIDDLIIQNDWVKSASMYRNRLPLGGWKSGWYCIDPISNDFAIRLSENGRIMLKARDLTSSEEAISRLKELLSFSEPKLQGTAWQALGRKLAA